MDKQDKINEKLLKAAENGDLGKVKTLLRRGADINYKDQRGKFSALHCAARNGHLEVINHLCSRNADIDSRNKWERTPLQVAVIHGHTETAEALILKGAEVDAINSYGCTALHVAAYWCEQIEMSRLLVEHGASVNIKDNDGITPIGLAALKKSTDVFEFLSNDIARLGMQTAKDFKNLVEQGSYESHDSRIYLVGPYNVGKTTLATVLVNDEFPNERCSTNGIWLYLRRAGMDVEEREWIFFKPEICQTSSVLEGFLLSVNCTGVESSDSAITTEGENKRKTQLSEPVAIKKHKIDIDSLDATSNIVRHPQNTTQQHLGTSICIPAVTHVSIHSKITELLKSGNYREKIAPVDIWDFGGQDVYYVTHQLFICHRGTFVLMFDGSKELNEQLKVYSYLPGFSDLPTTSVYLEHWVNSILTYCKNAKDGYPKILFVATHRDLIPKERVEKRRRQLIHELETLFENHSGRRHLIFNPLMFVNATDKTDREIKALKSQIVSLAFSHPRWGERMPVAWVPLELQIAMRVEKGTFILTKDEFIEMNASNNSMVLDELQIETFLKVQTSLGKLMYFDVLKLNKYIIINPLCLIQVLKSIVTFPAFWPDGPEFQDTLMLLSSKGVLSKQSLIRIWQQVEFSHFLPYKDFMIDILCHLDILVEQRRYDYNPDIVSENYLVPCMITTPYNRNIVRNMCSPDNSLCLVYNFEETIIPSGLSYRVMSSCLSIWNLKMNEGRSMLFAGCAIFNIDTHHDFLLCIDRKRINVYLINAHGISRIVRDIASSIQECLTISIKKISEKLHASSSYTLTVTKGVKDVVDTLPFDIQLKLLCDCFISYKVLMTETRPVWSCQKHGVETSMTNLNIWFPKKRTANMKQCPHNPGLKITDLTIRPTNKHLMRLCRQMTFESCRELAMRLNIDHDTCQNIVDQYKSYIEDSKFMFLWKWKSKNRSSSLQDILTLLEQMGENVHKICQIFVREEIPEGIGEDDLNAKPKYQFLDELPVHIGIEALHLGVELDFDVPELECIRYEYDRNLVYQAGEILKRWSLKENATLRILVDALSRIERGMDCLFEHYKK